MKTKTTKTIVLYWDMEGGGWAWQTTYQDDHQESGPVDGDLPFSSSMEDVIDAAGSDLPEDVARLAWHQLDDCSGWEAR